MKYLDLTFTDPAANLACDEALLDYCESRNAGEILRLWEPTEHFVVLGYSNKISTEVNLPGCRANRVPVYRRFSGGGAVLQGPGCLNYALAIRNERIKFFHNIAGSFKAVLERHQRCFTELLGQTIEIEGISDLAIAGKKFSGNSQHRKLRYSLFHGTFLLNLDFSLVEATLHMPSKEPGYRAHRSHVNFLRNLLVDTDPIRNKLKEAWRATETMSYFPEESVQRICRERYSRENWNFKF